MPADRRNLRLLLAAAAVAALAFAAPAHGALTAPVLLDPGNGASVEALPAFAWSPVPGAYQYEFQVAADQNFNSPVLARGEGSFSTKNTRATLKKTLPNGRYWWRVRATSKSGDASPWSTPRSLVKAWTAVPSSQTPAPGYPFTFPGAPISLGWAPVNYAASYFVSLASDPALANVVINNGQPLETWATNYVPTFSLLPSGTYYWNVTPVDSEGNKGTASPVRSFYWAWPSTTTAFVSDLMTADEMFDPQFSWNAVAGATKYEVEVNSSVDFAPGSKVCCSQLTVSTSMAPTVVFRDNTYYWRVRALDAAGNAGVWNRGPDFIKTFDKVPPVTAPSIKNLHMRDNLNDPGTDLDGGTPGYQTQVPVVSWDSVPGASSYLVDVAPYTGGLCTWGGPGSWRVNQSRPSWTPLGNGWNGIKPYPDAIQVAYEVNGGPLALNQTYCARVRARGERDNTNQEVYGDFTYLDDGTGNGTAFQWTGYPAGGACTPSCNPGYAGADDYLLPARGTLTRLTPLLTWKPLAGKASYYVIVAKDANFSNIVDYAFTKIPVYSPRSFTKPTTYSDETTLYYWALLPATNADGSGAVGDPLAAAASTFQKQSIPPSQTLPADGALLGDQPVFRWTSVEGARKYRFQIAQEPTFAAPIEDVSTAATSYTPFTTHPADTTLYWRVRADDENLIGLTWSTTRTFQRKLPAAVPDPTNVTISDFTPDWRWFNVTGASGYTFAIDGPDGSHNDYPGLRMTSATFVYLFGPGIWRWRVRAEFPKLPSGTVTGPWSSYVPFTRTLSEPSGVKTSVSGHHVLLQWNWKLGVTDYRVQISQRPDFATTLEDVTTDNTSYAPVMTHPFYANGGTFYWRVAGRDKSFNLGDWSAAGRIDVAQRLKVAVNRPVLRRRWNRITVTVSNPTNKRVAGATVRLSGAGLKARKAKTNRKGQVSFRLRPRKKGRLLFSATKAGYAAGSLSMRIS
jgi:large repetitive protein